MYCCASYYKQLYGNDESQQLGPIAGDYHIKLEFFDGFRKTGSSMGGAVYGKFAFPIPPEPFLLLLVF